jgi:PST family polysaccharide transporter
MRKVLENMGYQLVAQVATYLLPLATIPYITRTIGPEYYGRIEFVTTVILFVSVLVAFGFDVTATRSIAQSKEDEKKTSEIISGVFYSRLLLCVLAGVLLIIGLAISETLREYSLLLGLSFLSVLAIVVQPEFIFMGIQRLRPLAVWQLSIKVISAVLIFSLLREPEQFYYVIAINAGVNLLVSLVFWAWVLKKLSFVELKRPNWLLMKKMITESFENFLIHFFVRIQTFGTILFLALLLAEKDMGLYASVAKLILVGQSLLLLPIAKAVFPHFSKEISQDIHSYFRVFHRFMGVYAILSLGISLFVVWQAEFLVLLVFGEAFLAAVPLMQSMSILLFLATLRQFTGRLGLQVLSNDRYNLYLVVLGGILTIVFSYFGIKAYGLMAAAYARIAADAIVVIISFFVFYREWNRYKERDTKTRIS